jgi:hypothetical protein
MNKSNSIKELAGALCKAQEQMCGAVKDSKNPFFKSSYADLGAVVKAIKEPFADNGLSYSQFPLFVDGKVGVETILMHTSGEWLSGEIVLPMTKQDPQAAGSAITYARRYALQSIAGIPAEDDDGNHASKPAAKQAAKPAAKQAAKPAAKQKISSLTDNDLSWIAAAKTDPQSLEQIEDLDYRAFIKSQLGG